eukprot:2660643-Rhodomonas_salina.2
MQARYQPIDTRCQPTYLRVHDVLGPVLFGPVLTPYMLTKQVVRDEAVNYAVLSGLDLSRAYVKEFRHNDVADLE